MSVKRTRIHLAIVGGGPSALFLYKHLISAGIKGLAIDIFEKDAMIGAGMPYSSKGASAEHSTNVSASELPELVLPFEDWLKQLPETSLKKHMGKNEVLPRLLLGQYLAVQFDLLLAMGKKTGVDTRIFLDTPIDDIHDQPDANKVELIEKNKNRRTYDCVIICTGHCWPNTYENTIPGYYDSPYPPSKLNQQFDHPVAIRGASLTAVDAMRTLALANGEFAKTPDGQLKYKCSSDGFKIIMHSINGLLPALRFYQEDRDVNNIQKLLPADLIERSRKINQGFLPLDLVFEQGFKVPLREKDPVLYEKIKDLRLETFVDWVMHGREKIDAFALLKAECAEAETSIRRQQPIHWKALLADLSAAMNYAAKHFSAEDMLRLRKKLMPLISIVIASLPQGLAQEVLAMHEAGRLDLIGITEPSEIRPLKEGGIQYLYVDEAGNSIDRQYATFVDCIGQPSLSLDDFPFRSLVRCGTVSRAYLKFRDPDAGRSEMEKQEQPVHSEKKDFYLEVPGLAINDEFQVLNTSSEANPRVYIMAVPYIGGYNPDYSGLDFCYEASRRIVGSLQEQLAPKDRTETS
jgi:hypothetical protein